MDPLPLTLRQLVAMARARGEAEWARVSLICVLLAEPNRDRKKRPRPFTTDDFNPFRRRDPKADVIPTRGLGVLKDMFVGTRKAAVKVERRGGS